MKTKFIEIPLIILLLAFLGIGCHKDEIPDNPRKAEDFIGKYSGTIKRIPMAKNGWIIDNVITEKIQTDIIITPIEGIPNGLMVYITTYHDSISTEYDPTLGNLFITAKPYSFYLRTNDFPKFDGIYDHAVSTYGNLNDSKDRFGINFLKNLNDSIYLCDTNTTKTY